ncbi:MAG: hypothetical protein GXO54_03865 [Chloroflexi bacterium]|nr:hypothetical protein [Chloroflexota bacterium]
MEDRRPGCLGGLLRLLLLAWVYDWLQERMGFDRGGCSGVGCGCLLLVLFLIFLCYILFSTDWTRLGLMIAPLWP